MNKKWLSAVSILVGTTIGVGMFGIPYAVNRVGFLVGLVYFGVLGVVNLLINLAYAEVVLRTSGDHQLTGYGERYFGRVGKTLAFFALVFGLVGAMVAYIIKGGDFLAILFPRVTAPAWSLIFFMLCALTVFLGLKAVGWVENVLVLALLLAVGILIVVGWPVVRWENLVVRVGAFHPSTGSGTPLHGLLLPYGVLLFALSGSSVIPEVEEVLRNRRKLIKPAIIVGSLLPAFVYLIFTLVVIGVCGAKTSDDAIRGLVGFLPNWVVSLGAVIGVLAIITSFLTCGFSLREVYHRDFGFSKKIAWFFACFLPLAIYLLGGNDFIQIIGLTGTVGIGLTAILIITLLFRAREDSERKPEFTLGVNNWVLKGALILFVLGALVELLPL